jgi:hypothetical protein
MIVLRGLGSFLDERILLLGEVTFLVKGFGPFPKESTLFFLAKFLSP